MFYALIGCYIPWMKSHTSSSTVRKWAKWSKRLSLSSPSADFPTLLKHGPRCLFLWPPNFDFRPASGENHWQLVSLQSLKVNSLFFWPWWLVTVQWKKLRRWNLLWKARPACVYRVGAKPAANRPQLWPVSAGTSPGSLPDTRGRKNEFTFRLKSCFFESFAQAQGKSPRLR